MTDQPPIPRYKLTLTITGNTLYEIERELLVQTQGGFMLDSDRYRRDEWKVIGGKNTRVMEHVNPEMTPERYEDELDKWFSARKAARRDQP